MSSFWRVCEGVRIRNGRDAAGGRQLAAGSGKLLFDRSSTLLQAYLLFGDESFLDMFAEAYASAMGAMQLVGEYSQLGWLVDVHAGTGRISRVWISSLAAFWPGMQALIGGFKSYTRDGFQLTTGLVCGLRSRSCVWTCPF